MYYKSQGIFNLEIPFLEYYNSIDKIETIKKHIYEQTKQKIFSDIGIFVYPIEIKKIISSTFNGLNPSKLFISINLIFVNFLPIVNTNVLTIVDQIEPKQNIIAAYGPFRTFIHSSQLPDNFKFVKTSKSLISENKQIKEGDILKCKIVEYGRDEYNSPRIRLTLRQPNLGKISWWT